MTDWLTDMVSLAIIVALGVIALHITHAPDWATVLLVITVWSSAVFR